MKTTARQCGQNGRKSHPGSKHTFSQRTKSSRQDSNLTAPTISAALLFRLFLVQWLFPVCFSWGDLVDPLMLFSRLGGVARHHFIVVDNRSSDQWNLAHVDPSLPRASTACVLRHYAASVLIYSVLLAFLHLNPWFKSLLRSAVGSFTVAHVYYIVYGGYVVLAPIILLLARPSSLWNSKNVMVVAYVARFIGSVFSVRPTSEKLSWAPTYAEKHALMFLVIKLIYGPLMISSAFFSFNQLQGAISFLDRAANLLQSMDGAYRVLVPGVFFLDSALFCFGYHMEAGFLRNRVRYVETSLPALAVCLMCYPPFNQFTVSLFGPSNYNENILFLGDLRNPLTWILRGMAAFFLIILLASSYSLFTRASNLTNRGIVTWGAYAIVRHPGYTAKNLFWFTTMLPIFFNINPQAPQFSWLAYFMFCATTLMGFVAWTTIYILRALTEEKLLRRDPDYIAYCQKVKYRFIPGLV